MVNCDNVLSNNVTYLVGAWQVSFGQSHYLCDIQVLHSIYTCFICPHRHWLKVSVSLLVVMGISWIIGVITFHKALLFVSYIFTIVVAFQVCKWNIEGNYGFNSCTIFYAGCYNVCHVCHTFQTGKIL